MKKVSFVIPVYNEAEHLVRFLELIDSLELDAEKELIIIDDCSKDSSAEIIKNYKFKSAMIFLQQIANQGKGAAIREGIDSASGDFILIQDADFEYDPSEIPALLDPLLNNKADVVYGSRFRKNGNQVHRTVHYLGNRVLTMMSNIFSGLYLSDMETCYKLFRADVIKNIVLENNRFGFEPEVTAKIAKLKLRVLEFPISYFPRNYLEGKKITWKDGVAALWHIIYFNVFTAWDKCFKSSLPAQYKPRDAHWL